MHLDSHAAHSWCYHGFMPPVSSQTRFLNKVLFCFRGTHWYCLTLHCLANGLRTNIMLLYISHFHWYYFEELIRLLDSIKVIGFTFMKNTCPFSKKGSSDHISLTNCTQEQDFLLNYVRWHSYSGFDSRCFVCTLDVLILDVLCVYTHSQSQYNHQDGSKMAGNTLFKARARNMQVCGERKETKKI